MRAEQGGVVVRGLSKRFGTTEALAGLDLAIIELCAPLAVRRFRRMAGG